MSSDIIKSCAIIAPSTGSFFELEGNLVLSACKPAWNEEKGAIILRLMNVSDQEESAVVKFDRPIKSAEYCRLDETKTGAAVFSGSQLSVTAGKWAYVTLKIKF